MLAYARVCELTRGCSRVYRACARIVAAVTHELEPKLEELEELEAKGEATAAQACPLS